MPYLLRHGQVWHGFLQRGGNHMMDLSKIKGPVILAQAERKGYRDPAAFYHDGVCYLYFTMVEQDGE